MSETSSDPTLSKKDDLGGGQTLYSIGAAARFAGIHPQTLRWYEKRGLLKPLRTGGNARRYTATDLAQLLKIKNLTRRGVGLEAVRMILALEEEKHALSERLSDLEREVSALERKLAMLVASLGRSDDQLRDSATGLSKSRPPRTENSDPHRYQSPPQRTRRGDSLGAGSMASGG